ncbi:MAG: serine hydrolase, partial [Anaerolineales bacterium]
ATPKEVLLPTAIEELTVTNTIHAKRDLAHLPATTDLLELPKTTASETKNMATQKPIFTDSQRKEPIYNRQNYQPIEEQIERIIAQSGGRWHIIIKEVGGETIFSLLPEQRINIASVVKVPFALLFFEALKENGITEGELKEYIHMTGTGGRTFDQLLYAMLVKSEEDATEIVYTYIKRSINIPVQLREWEITGLDLDARRFTALGVAAIFERLFKGEFVSPTSRSLILEYMNTYTPNDDFRIGSIREKIPETYRIYNKRGSLLTPYVVADCAILENPDGADFIITIFAYNSEPKTTYEQLDKAIGEISQAFWEYISNKD